MQNMDKNLTEKEEKKKRGFGGFAVRFLVIIFIAFLLSWGLGEYRKYEGRKKLDRLVEETERLQKEEYDRAMADTYGGKTPQETLRMYIEAVEKGDYELASRYLISSKSDKEAGQLKSLERKGNIKSFLEILRNAVALDTLGDNTTFRMESKISNSPAYIIDFIKYPNGIWKIIEI
jgi:hypothetical protein